MALAPGFVTSKIKELGLQMGLRLGVKFWVWLVLSTPVMLGPWFEGKNLVSTGQFTMEQ